MTVDDISIDVICGKTPPTADPENYGGNIPFITIPDMHGSVYTTSTKRFLSEKGVATQANKTLPENSICVSCIASVGLVCLTAEPSQTNQQINSIVCKKNISPFYIYIKMTTLTDYLKQLGAGGSTTLNVNLEAQTSAIYHSLFDEQSEWSKGFVSDFGDLVGGATPSKDVDEYFCSDGIVWLTPKDLTSTEKKFIYKGETDITDAAYRSCSTKMLPKGSVLLTSRAPVGCVAIAMTDLCTNQGFKSIIPFREIGTAFVYYFLKENKQLLESHSSGTTFMEISGNVLKDIPVSIPPESLTQKFTALCQPIFAHQEQIETEIAQLIELQRTMVSQISSH